MLYGGIAYTIEKRVGDTIYWKCTNSNKTKGHAKCHGRAKTTGLFHPVTVTVECDVCVLPVPEREEVLESTTKMIEQAQISNDPPRLLQTQAVAGLSKEAALLMPAPVNLTKRIHRARPKNAVASSSSTTDTLVVNSVLTHGHQDFLWADSGQESDRVLIFSTRDNIDRLAKSDLWYADGIFDASPYMLSQLYTIHII